MQSLPQHVGRNFRVEGLIGSGGTSRVLQVVDVRSGARLALKQHMPSNSNANAARLRSDALFRQEFHVLSRIVHPNVVRAFEYGVDEHAGAFYTMELLRGRPLSELVPITWQRLCAIILDLCSPLSILHSRRFVHCDVTARNVVITENGETKLIDFGALTPLDRPATVIAGTPPHMAPELLRRQSLDGRTDMFAIGALAYSLLSGRHAYPAHTVQELPQLWLNPAPSLQDLGVEVPRALDELIMSLLSLDVSARPLQLAELVRRVSALVHDAYAPSSGSLRAELAIPKLIGREPALAQFRDVHNQAASNQPQLLCVCGEAGMGRSRMLEVFALEAIQAGSLVVHLGSDDAPKLPYGLVGQVFRSACAQDSALESQLPAALRGALEASIRDCEPVARLLQEQPRTEHTAYWRALCQGRCVVVLLDDVARADVLSIQHVLGLSELTAPCKLVLVAAVTTGAAALERDVAALMGSTRTARLDRLTPPETTQLLRSILGEATGLESLAAWIHRAAGGNPGACVELARHALEHGYLQFGDGQFTVSQEVLSGRAALPQALAEAFAREIDQLPTDARQALAALCLLTPFGPLNIAEQAQLLREGSDSTQDPLELLDQLRDAQLIVLADDGYEPRLESIARYASAQLSLEQRYAWHLRIAGLYERRGHDFSMLTSLHYDWANRRDLAYARLLGLHATLRGPDDPNIKLGGSQLGIALHQRMLEHAVTLGAPRAEVVHYRRVLVLIGATANASLGAHGREVVDALCDDVGLSFWDSTPTELSEHTRLVACLERAKERFASATPGERLEPLQAIHQLAEVVAALAGIASATHDPALAKQLVERFRPLRTLVPALAVTYNTLEASARALAQGAREQTFWYGQLQALQSRPEGLPQMVWAYLRNAAHFHLGRELAQLGDPTALEHAQALDQHARTETQACSVRLLYALAQGDHETAALQRQRRAIAALASRHDDQRLSSSYLAEIELLDACGDLLGLQRIAAWVEGRAKQFDGFEPFAAYARACCHLLCGEVAQAHRLIEGQVHRIEPFTHAAWYSIRSMRAEVALLSGEAALARDVALEVLNALLKSGRDVRPHTRALRVAVLAHATLGSWTEAHAVLQPWLDEITWVPAPTSVYVGQLVELSTRLALMQNDRAAFWQHYARLQAIYSRHKNPGLMARLARLTAAATHSQSSRALDAAALSVQTGFDRLSLNEQLDQVLALLVRDAGALSGHLYGTSRGAKTRWLRSYDALTSDPSLDARVAQYAQELASRETDRTQTVASLHGHSILHELTDGSHEHFSIVVLRGSDELVHGLALLRSAAGTVATPQTHGLCTIVADLLGKASRFSATTQQS